WTGTTPLVFSYRWLRCPASGGQVSGSDCTAITGATGTQYELTADDVGRRIRLQVTARHTLGSATATSDATARCHRPADDTLRRDGARHRHRDDPTAAAAAHDTAAGSDPPPRWEVLDSGDERLRAPASGGAAARLHPEPRALAEAPARAADPRPRHARLRRPRRPRLRALDAAPHLGARRAADREGRMGAAPDDAPRRLPPRP